LDELRHGKIKRRKKNSKKKEHSCAPERLGWRVAEGPDRGRSLNESKRESGAREPEKKKKTSRGGESRGVGEASWEVKEGNVGMK